METKDTIKFFTSQERIKFFNALEYANVNAKTSYAKKCSIRNEAMFKILYYCALRATEVTLIKTEYFNALKTEIYCKRLKGGKNNTLEIVERDIVISLKKHITYNKPNEYLFENFKTNSYLSRKTIYHIFKKTCKAAGITNEEKMHPHTLRHTRAIYLAESGFDLKELQYWLGHAHVSNTMIYFQFTSKQQHAMYKKLRNKEKS